MSSIGDSEDYSSTQFSIFKDSLARRLLSLDLSSSPSTTTADDAAELDDFTTYLAHESWPSLPSPLRTASHETASSLITPDDIDADTLPLESTPPAFIESLVSYGYTADSDASITFLRKTLREYLVEACAAPPPWSATRTTECEICEREVPLTYHHLIPRSTHTKVLKKGWHKENMLGSVAWLCRACHSTVHRVATNDELARSYYTVDSLLEREDIQRWRRYAARQRFGIRWRSRLQGHGPPARIIPISGLPDPEHWPRGVTLPMTSLFRSHKINASRDSRYNSASLPHTTIIIMSSSISASSADAPSSAHLPPSRDKRALKKVDAPLSNTKLHRLIYLLAILTSLLGAFYAYRIVQWKTEVGGWWNLATGQRHPGAQVVGGNTWTGNPVSSPNRGDTKKYEGGDSEVEDRINALADALGMPPRDLAVAIASAVKEYVPPASLSSVAERETGKPAVDALLGQGAGAGRTVGQPEPTGIIGGVLHGMEAAVGMDEP